MEQEPILNAHNKEEYPPMHTTEHILNRTMVNMFGCERSRNAHIERKKSKCDYHLHQEPTAAEMAEIERRVNEVIDSNVDVTIDFVDRQNVPADVDLSKLPTDASETLRLVRVGDYDVCACIGSHVKNTAEIAAIGHFKILSADYTPSADSAADGVWRVRFKLA
jgi:alanyl-tRNA synthetase